uniref:E3 ubiquitin-protein ligase Topors-like isoform X2 n=1 Tax=Scatophagus argus TaxID=75038 RepID=UPI001ED8552B|nr:E3 ubiquitin-protein ligase Topors-like isoform X2 [Scatophagus argus]
MPLSVRNSVPKKRKNPDEKLPERPGESASSAQVMAPTRMKLRVRRRGNVAGGTGGADRGGQPEEEEGRSQESGGRSSRRKSSHNTSAGAATTSSSPPSSSASARAVITAEEASPDSKCPICLDRFNNLAYLDRCLHRFCFPCIQEWSHNKAECPLCKQPFTSILHSVRAEDDFKEYTLRPAPTNSSVAATVAMVAAMASAARSNHQMRLMLRRHRAADVGETTTRRWRRERSARARGGRSVGERTGVWEWYLDSPPLALPPLPQHPAVSPVVAEDSEDVEDPGEQGRRAGADLDEHGVIFEGLTGLGGAVASVVPNDRASRRLMTRLAARRRLQREGGTVRRLRERETVAFRRTLYRCGIRVHGVAGVGIEGQQQRDITVESFRRNPVHLNRLRPWLRRELTVLYGAHGSLVDIVQRIIMARLARHGLEDTPTIEEELRPFLLARADHFLHELVSFARSPLSLENYDLQAVYEPPATAQELDGTSSSTDSSSVIAISEGEEEEGQAGGRPEETLLGRGAGAHDDVIQAGSCLSLSAWDDETPGPSYTTAEPSCSLASLSFSPASQGAPTEEGGEKQEGEEECLIVGYKKPIAERTPELVQLSSDTEEEEDKEKKEEENVAEEPPPLHATTPDLHLLTSTIIPPSTSGAYRDEQADKPKEKDGGTGSCRSRVWSGSSERSRNSVCSLSPKTPGESERRRDRGCWRDRKQAASEAAREKRRRKRSRREREKSSDMVRKSGTLCNPNLSIYPAAMRRRSRTPSSFHSSTESSPPDSNWEYRCSQVSPLTSSDSSPSRSSSSSSLHWSSPRPSAQPPLTPSLSPSNRSSSHHGEKPGGKRKYKSRHLDNNDKDPTWRPSSSHRREKRRERREKERRRRRRERQRRGALRDSGGDSRRCREDRSPSVEIIYEGTITSHAATRTPAGKRRRKQPRRTQHCSSPVIITLDSDSSRDDINNNNNNNNSSGSSSPVSSQQTVDFSDLPPLPLLHSARVDGALNAEIGELPVDILDRGSDGSETEPVGQPEAARSVGIYNSDNSDREVDVENVDERGSLLGSDDDKRPMRRADAEAGTVDSDSPTAESNAASTATDLVHKTDSEFSTSDSRLLATILNDLKGIAAPKRDHSFGFESSCLSGTRKKHFRAQREVSQAYLNQDDWLAEARHPSLPEQQQSNDGRGQSQSLGLPTFHASIPPLPHLEQLKERRVREEAKDLPPLLKQASPVGSRNRNTPPPLKHGGAGSQRLLSHVDPRSPHTSADANPGVELSSDSTISSMTSCLGAELPKDNQAIPPISTLKKHFMSTLALRGEPVSTRDVSAVDMLSSCDLAAISSHSSAPSQVGAVAIHSTTHKPTTDSHSENTSASADCLPHLDFSSFGSSKLHAGIDSTKEISSDLRPSPIELHPVNSLSPTDFHSAEICRSKAKSAHSDSTSTGYRNRFIGPNVCWVAPTDLHPSSSVSAEGALAGRDDFSGANCNNMSPAGFVSSTDTRTLNPCSPIDSYSSSERENLAMKLSPSRVSSVPTTPASARSLPSYADPTSPKSTVDRHSSSAASEGPTDNDVSSLIIREESLPHGRLPPVDVHCTSLMPPANEHCSSFVSTMTDDHLDHRALSSTAFQTSHRKCSSQSKPPAESQSKPLRPIDSDSNAHNHFDSSSNPQFPIDTCSEHSSPIDSQHESQPPIDSHSKTSRRDFQLPAANHITSSPQSVENQWNSSIDAHS